MVDLTSATEDPPNRAEHVDLEHACDAVFADQRDQLRERELSCAAFKLHPTPPVTTSILLLTTIERTRAQISPRPRPRSFELIVKSAPLVVRRLFRNRHV